MSSLLSKRFKKGLAALNVLTKRIERRNKLLGGTLTQRRQTLQNRLERQDPRFLSKIRKTKQQLGLLPQVPGQPDPDFIDINLTKPLRVLREDQAESSNIWKTRFDRSNNIMYVLFNSGDHYKYFDVPWTVYLKVITGQASAKTKGKNEYGQWYIDKSPSIGAAFDKYIKKGGYRYEKIGFQSARPPTLRRIA